MAGKRVRAQKLSAEETLVKRDGEMGAASTTRHTCLKLEVGGADPIFVKGTWLEARFDLSISDGCQAWVCAASEEEVRERAAQWDQPVAEYIDLAERYLGFQQPGSVYGFSDAGEGHKRLSWTFKKEGTKLEWRWKCKPSPDSKKLTTGILDFLMNANIRLSEEVVCKNRSFEKMKTEAEKCLELSEKFCNEKTDFESATYAKFVCVLNSKKAKLRDLRDKLMQQDSKEEVPEEEASTDKTESFDEGSDENQSGEEDRKKEAKSSKTAASTSKGRPGRKRAVPL